MPAITRRIHRRSSPVPPSTSDMVVNAPPRDLPGSSPPTSDNEPRTRPIGLVAGGLTTKSGKTKRILPENPTIGQILKLAQFIKRGIDLWVNIPQAVNVGVANEVLELYEDLDPEDEGYDEDQKAIAEQIMKKCGKQKEALLKAYDGIMRLFAPYKTFIEDLDDAEKLTLWSKVNTCAEQGRNNDMASLKKDAHAYVLKVGHPNPPLGCHDSKSTRGVSHPQLLRMIVPMHVLANHGNDPDFEDTVRGKKYVISHKSIPAFMFDLDSYDPKKPEKTLLRGYYPLRVFRHIFTSPSSAFAEPGKKGKATRAGNAAIAGQKQVTPEMIAYACVQARFYISKLKVFGTVDETFNVKKFYYAIIEFFSDEESEWVKNTLAWWNEQVFSDSAGESEDEQDTDESEDETSFANMFNRTRTQAHLQSQTQFDSQYSQDAFISEA